MLLLVAAGKLVEVQAISAGDLAADAAKQRMTKLVIPAERGAILDRNGTPLAFSVEAKALVANPRRITADWSKSEVRAVPGAPTPDQRKATIAQGMAAILHADPLALFSELMSDKAYVVLAPLVDPTAARDHPDAVPGDRLGGPGVAPVPGRRRRRFGGGQRLVEPRQGPGQRQRRASRAARTPPSPAPTATAIVDTAEGSDAVIPGSTRAEQPAQAGRDVVLTLDSDLQYTVQQQALGLRGADRREGRQRGRPRREDRPDPLARQQRGGRGARARRRRGDHPVRAGLGEQGGDLRRGPRRRPDQARRRSSPCRAASRSPTARSTTRGRTARCT